MNTKIILAGSSKPCLCVLNLIIKRSSRMWSVFHYLTNLHATPCDCNIHTKWNFAYLYTFSLSSSSSSRTQRKWVQEVFRVDRCAFIRIFLRTLVLLKSKSTNFCLSTTYLCIVNVWLVICFECGARAQVGCSFRLPFIEV